MTEDGNPGGTATDLRYTAVPATVDRLPRLRHALADWSEHVGLADSRIEDLSLAVYEALANAVQHAYRDGPGTLDLHATHSRQHNTVDVTIADRGQWQPPPADPGPLHGRGLPLMRDLADSVEVRPQTDGTVVVLHWYL